VESARIPLGLLLTKGYSHFREAWKFQKAGNAKKGVHPDERLTILHVQKSTAHTEKEKPKRAWYKSRAVRRLAEEETLYKKATH